MSERPTAPKSGASAPSSSAALASGGSADSLAAPDSLARSTEQEGIVVDEGYCDLDDPSFSDAADRIACLELAQLESKPSGGESAAGGSRNSSSRSLGGTKPKRAAAGSSQANPRRAQEPGPQSLASSAPAASAVPARLAAATSVSGSGDLPPGTPFGQLEFQSSVFPTITAQEAEAKLKTLGLDKQLLSGLQSLSMDELAVYMQLTDELKREGLGQSFSKSSLANASSGEGSCSSEVASSKDDEERLESAVRTLKALLPESAIRQLQSHASYGLVDIMQSQPLTPPPTPTSTVTTDNN